MQMKKQRVAAAAFGLLNAIMANGAIADATATNDIPEALSAPAGQALAVSARGVGVQTYQCSAAKDDARRFSWTLKGPDAKLHDASGKMLGKHYAGPTWEASDGSKVTGEVIAHDDGPDSSAIPWLLLRAKSSSGPGVFSAILSIQRLHTVGGKAPAGGCDQPHSGKDARVPYSADYRFYKAVS
jgi:hypothetical protein